MKRSLIQSVGLASLLSCLVWAQGQPPTVTAGGEVLEGVWSARHAGDRYLELGPVIEAKTGLKKSACDVLDTVYPRLWGPAR